MLFPRKICIAEEKPLLSKQNATPTHSKRSESVCRRRNIRPPSAIDQALWAAIPKGRPRARILRQASGYQSLAYQLYLKFECAPKSASTYICDVENQIVAAHDRSIDGRDSGEVFLSRVQTFVYICRNRYFYAGTIRAIHESLNADVISEVTKMAVLEVEKILNQKQNTTKSPASLLSELHA